MTDPSERVRMKKTDIYGERAMHNELTKVDIEMMKEEIEHRKTVLAPKLREDVKTARELGDLSENDEYRSAKRELNRNYSRIRYLTNMIETATIIEDHSTADTVGLFDRVTLRYDEDDEEDTVTIVTTPRIDVLSGCISKESPLGRVLVGRRVGERLLVAVNETTSYYVTVVGIEKGKDDATHKISSY